MFDGSGPRPQLARGRAAATSAITAASSAALADLDALAESRIVPRYRETQADPRALPVPARRPGRGGRDQPVDQEQGAPELPRRGAAHPRESQQILELESAGRRSTRSSTTELTLSARRSRSSSASSGRQRQDRATSPSCAGRWRTLTAAAARRGGGRSRCAGERPGSHLAARRLRAWTRCITSTFEEMLDALERHRQPGLRRRRWRCRARSTTCDSSRARSSPTAGCTSQPEGDAALERFLLEAASLRLRMNQEAAEIQEILDETAGTRDARSSSARARPRGSPTATSSASASSSTRRSVPATSPRRSSSSSCACA